MLKKKSFKECKGEVMFIVFMVGACFGASCLRLLYNTLCDVFILLDFHAQEFGSSLAYFCVYTAWFFVVWVLIREVIK